MQKFNYTHNLTTGLTERSLGETYLDLDSLNRTIVANTSPKLLNKIAINVYKGVAEQPIIKIEEDWWVANETIIDITDKLDRVNELTSSSYLDDTGVSVNYTEDELTDNKLQLEEMLLSEDVVTETVLTDKYSAQLTEVVATRNALEADNPWLVTYRGIDTTETRPVPVYNIPNALTKKLIAAERDASVRNSEDSIADLAKMNSLLFSIVSSIYTSMTPTAQAKIPAQERGLIEYAISEFANIQTRADRQLLTEGTALIDKLFQREVAIADIVDNLKKL